MPYYDQQGKPVDTSEYWRMPSHQAQHVVDHLHYNKRKNHATPPINNAGANYRTDRPFQGYAGGMPYYGARGFNSDVLIDAVRRGGAKLLPLAIWLLTRLGLHIATIAAYIATIGVIALQGDAYFSDGLLILISSGITACLLIGGLAGMFRQINQEALTNAAQQSLFRILGAGLQGWLRTAVFAASLPIIVVGGLYANRLPNELARAEEVIWYILPFSLALCHVAMTKVVRRSWALSLCALSVLSAAGLFLLGA